MREDCELFLSVSFFLMGVFSWGYFRLGIFGGGGWGTCFLGLGGGLVGLMRIEVLLLGVVFGGFFGG